MIQETTILTPLIDKLRNYEQQLQHIENSFKDKEEIMKEREIRGLTRIQEAKCQLTTTWCSLDLPAPFEERILKDIHSMLVVEVKKLQKKLAQELKKVS